MITYEFECPFLASIDVPLTLKDQYVCRDRHQSAENQDQTNLCFYDK